MRIQLRGLSFAISVAAFALQWCSTAARAVDTMADWVGQNTQGSTWAPDNNYGVISATSVGGQIQSKVNFSAAVPGEIASTNDPFIFLSDQALEGPMLSFNSEMHMTGTITFNNTEETQPNLCFCWYNGANTAKRIGLGISNLTVAQGGAEPGYLRVDFGYGALPSNFFSFVSDDGTGDQTNLNSLIPNGSYPFTFDYVPQAGGGPGGTMSATVGAGGEYFRLIAPLPTQPWDAEPAALDRFGIVQRSTGNTTQLGKYNIVLSNVTYTGGTAVPEPAAWVLFGLAAGALALFRCQTVRCPARKLSRRAAGEKLECLVFDCC